MLLCFYYVIYVFYSAFIQDRAETFLVFLKTHLLSLQYEKPGL